MVLDRLGVITDEVSSNFLEALDWAVNQGLKHVELRVVDGVNVLKLEDEKIQFIRKEVERRGLFISAIASPIFKCALDSNRPVADGDRFGQEEEDVKAHFEKLHRAIDIAKMLDTKIIRIFSFWREKEPKQFDAEIVAYLKQAAKIADAQNIQLLLENENSCNGGLTEEVVSLVEKVGSPSLQALWDPGNEQFVGSSVFPDSYRLVRRLMKHVHLKDAKWDVNKKRAVPIGSGVVPYLDIFNALKEDHYDGLFTLETHYVPEGGTVMDGTYISLQGLRGMLKKADLN